MQLTTTGPIWGILLAAGQGLRYAEQAAGADKLLATFSAGQYVLAASAQALASQTDYALAITSPDHPQRSQTLQGSTLELIHNPNYQQGMGLSLALAAQHLRQRASTHTPPLGVLIALGDMPTIHASSYQAVAQALANHPIAAPTYKTKRGHPVGFNWSMINELCELQGDQGARQLLKRYGFYAIPTTDAGVLVDIDLPQHLNT